jgi:hypothetical protein
MKIKIYDLLLDNDDKDKINLFNLFNLFNSSSKCHWWLLTSQINEIRFWQTFDYWIDHIQEINSYYWLIFLK